MDLVRSALHLASLSSFVIAWQYLEPLSKAGDTFIEQGATGLDVALFAVALVVVPPAVMVLLEWLAGLVDVRLRDWLHIAFVAGLIGLGVWQQMNEVPVSAAIVIAVGALAGLGGALIYRRFAGVRLYLTALSFAPALVLALFLVFSPVRALVFGGEGRPPVSDVGARTPVVMVVLDELPVVSLLDARGRIDSGLFPNFARFASESTWYRNTATVSDYTQVALPTLLTGRSGDRERLPVAAEHPDGLFRLLGGSYRLDVSEFPTDLCGAACPVQEHRSFLRRVQAVAASSIGRIPALPSWVNGRLTRALTRGLASSLPEVERVERSVRRHLPLAQEDRFDAFLSTLRPSSGRTLNFLHVLLPHRPWRLLPSGGTYVDRRRYTSVQYGAWPQSGAVTRIAHQRHLLQLVLVDRLVGRLIRRLEEVGLYDKALVVLAADHGSSFKPGAESRTVTEANVEEIAPVPFFVKSPGQRRGRVSNGFVETVDVLPTIARELGVRIPWRVDGRPAQTAGRTRRTLTVHPQKGGDDVVIGHSDLVRRRDASLLRKLAMFGSGDLSRLFALGGHRALIGRSLRGLTIARMGTASATLDNPEQFRGVDVTADVVPAVVSGTVAGGGGEQRRIAVAVNGRVEATALTLPSAGSEMFSVLVPASALQAGDNPIEVFALSGPPRRPLLTPLLAPGT